MRLLWARMDRFRNLEPQKVSLHPRYNLILGANGQGKTNFLEALGYLCALRSIRSASRSDMIRRGSDRCCLEGEIETDRVHHSLAVTFSKNGRSARFDEKPLSSPDANPRSLSMVSFIPEDVGLIGGPPAHRRRAIDRAAFEMERRYADEYRRYLRVLRQRNSLLRRRRFTAAEKSAWDQEYCLFGAALVQRRCAAIARLNPILEDLGRRLGIGSGFHLAYIPSFAPPDRSRDADWTAADLEEIAAALYAQLERIADREVHAGHSLAGPHRDDVLFALKETEEGVLDLGRQGSQGQKRISVLAFKLAVAETIHNSQGSWPVILLDDVASELDSTRRSALGAFVREMKAQFFITTTGDDYMFLPAEGGSIWKMRTGRLEKAQGGRFVE